MYFDRNDGDYESSFIWRNLTVVKKFDISLWDLLPGSIVDAHWKIGEDDISSHSRRGILLPCTIPGYVRMLFDLDGMDRNSPWWGFQRNCDRQNVPIGWITDYIGIVKVGCFVKSYYNMTNTF